MFGFRTTGKHHTGLLLSTLARDTRSHATSRRSSHNALARGIVARRESLLPKRREAKAWSDESARAQADIAVEPADWPEAKSGPEALHFHRRHGPRRPVLHLIAGVAQSLLSARVSVCRRPALSVPILTARSNRGTMLLIRTLRCCVFEVSPSTESWRTTRFWGQEGLRT